MASAVSKNAVIIERCALCKIDLKGRFAYLDEEFMSLTGYSDEELLGKPISKILDADSGELIRSLVTDRNHYDTFLDINSLSGASRAEICLGNLIDNSKKRLLKLVISAEQ